mmetsp:Transcript_119435/g.207378  ORF Transcript_119435/g.207378 Transcript_119435/m.207378 type:complete len:364 (-) Transcript_119435:166-1257(-)
MATVVENGWREHHDNEVQFMDKLGRHKALTLLLSGATFGILGFAFAAIAGFWEKEAYDSAIGIKYPSGNPHFPLTVSEMVHDPASPTGKAFLGFELTAAVLLLTSWYPYMLCNVYVGERHALFSGSDHCCCGCISWSTLRQFLPALGLAIVALVTTTPTFSKKSSNVSFITCQIHILAATALFGGYILCEMQCLFQAVNQGVVKIGKMEWFVRSIVIVITAIGAVTTIVLQFTLPYEFVSDAICCGDQYERMTAENANKILSVTLTDSLIDQARRQETLRLYLEDQSYETDTASGTYLLLKMICFWAEVVAGVFGLASHIVIWYFAPERDVIVGDYIEFKDLKSRAANGFYADSDEYDDAEYE